MKLPSGCRGLVAFLFSVSLLLGSLLAAGCNEGPTPFPPADKNLRKTTPQLAADAAKRHPFKDEAPKGGIAQARAEVDYGFLHLINLTNLSDQDWDNVEIWVNHKYVIFVPKMARKVQETINFQLLFDDAGNSFPLSKARVESLDMYKDGKMYQIPLHLAD